MALQSALQRLLLALILLAVLLGSIGITVAHPAASHSAAPADHSDISHTGEAATVSTARLPSAMVTIGEDGSLLGLTTHEAGESDQLADADQDEIENEEEDGEAGAALIGDWWGLGGEAQEAPYMGLVELGVVLLAVGLAGYSVGKRTGLLPPQYRRYLLPAHEWTMLVGTALTVPHFLFVEEWEGLGLVVGILLAIEVLSGVYGRHLHRHVIRLGRGDETAPLVGYLLALPKKTLFSRWRKIHVMLTILTALVLVAHILTAIGD